MSAATNPVPPARPQRSLLIYQMGRVGSRTVLESVRAHPGGPDALFHYHRLQGLDALERELLGDPSSPARAIEYVRASQRFRHRLDAHPGPWDVVTLVRDPVARNLSAFFHQLPRYVADAALGPELPDRMLLAIFLERFDHRFALDWFDAELRRTFGVDVFATRFVFEGGQSTETDRARILLLRCEDLDAHLPRVMHRWLGLSELRVVRSNRGVDHDFGARYRRFAGEVILPDAYLDAMYASRLARHFYSREEIERFRARWRGLRPRRTRRR